VEKPCKREQMGSMTQTSRWESAMSTKKVNPVTIGRKPQFRNKSYSFQPKEALVDVISSFQTPNSSQLYCRYLGMANQLSWECGR
jgi:hypothetical protein